MTALAVLACLLQAPSHTASAATVYGQESHVERRYVKSTNLTLVNSDSLYVINMPTQFMRLEFSARYASQGPPTRPPDKITLLFQSYTTAPRYQKDESHRLAVKADEEVLDFGLMSYAGFRETGGKDAYMADEKARLGISSPLPPVALVRTANQGQPLTLESMSAVDVPLSRLTKLARASQLVMKIGDTVFALTPNQLGVLREFAAAVTPAGGAAAADAAPRADAPKLFPDVPSEANNAPLDSTLKWLKKELPRASATAGIAVPGQIEVEDFKGCKISYRVVPRFRNSPVSPGLVRAIVEYRFDLADINPESVRASDSEDFSMLTFNTVNQEQKIKVIARANDNGMAGRTLDETSKAGAIFYLRDANSAARIREAFVHAVGLCRTH